MHIDNGAFTDMKSQIALAVAAAIAFAGPTHAQSTSPLPSDTSTLGQDVSDIWWDPTQSGWGVQLNQMRGVVFATLYVYDASGRPTWFTAQLTAQSTGVYSGPLYSSTGPAFSAATFDPSQVTRTQVGTMTITLQADGSAILAYTVNGVTVMKNVQRQTLINADLTGSFRVFSTVRAASCANATDNGTTSGSGNVTITSTGGNNVQVVWVDPNNVTCTYNGTLNQGGRFGSLNGATYTCSTGETGSANLTGLTSTNGVFTGRLTGLVNSRGCSYHGAFSGINSQSQFDTP